MTLHRHEHGALDQAVTLLPPRGFRTTGAAATSSGFRKRGRLPRPRATFPRASSAGGRPARAVRPAAATAESNQLHHAPRRARRELEAESRLAFVAPSGLEQHLSGQAGPAGRRPGAGLAGQLRELIDAGFRGKVTLRQRSEVIHANPAHLVRTFSGSSGSAPTST